MSADLCAEADVGKGASRSERSEGRRRKENRMKIKMFWMVALSLSMTVSIHRATVAAEEDQPDFEAEKEQMAKEEAKAEADREKGLRIQEHLLFSGTVYLLAEPDKKIRPDVVGHFVTSLQTNKPRRTYQMILETPSNDLMEQLKEVNGKLVLVRGKLRLFDASGNAKYIFVESFEESGPTPLAPIRELPGGV